MKTLTRLSERQLRAQIERIEAAQKLMRDANAAIVRGDDDALFELGFSREHIEDLKRPNAYGTRGFPDSALANNTVTLQALEVELAALGGAPTRQPRVMERGAAYGMPPPRT